MKNKQYELEYEEMMLDIEKAIKDKRMKEYKKSLKKLRSATIKIHNQ